jgi:hypothetical protein
LKFLIFLLVIAVVACGRPRGKIEVAQPDGRVPALRTKYQNNLAEAVQLRDPVTGWLTPTDCDGALWTGKYAAATGVEGVDMTASEYPFAPGKFARRPILFGPCVVNDNRGSSWSRDMGTGLLAYGWLKKDLPLLERHAAYGNTHHWVMGDPIGDGRSVYTPAMIGKLYETIYALGGTANDNRLWPDLYPTGKVDYESHLEVMSIWQRGEIDAAVRGISTQGVSEDGTGLLDISAKALVILQEQVTRDPRDPLFQAVYGQYTGNMSPAIDACLAEDGYAGSYVRCDKPRTCQLAAWLFACDIVLRAYK